MTLSQCLDCYFHLQPHCLMSHFCTLAAIGQDGDIEAMATFPKDGDGDEPTRLERVLATR